MASVEDELSGIRVADMENFQAGPPHELFRRLRAECPVHWTDGITEYPDEDGFWSVTTAEDVHEVSRDWQTFSSEIGGFTAMKNAGLLAGDAAGDVHRHGPTQARPPQGTLPARLHAQAHRRARGCDPCDHHRGARPARRPRDAAIWSTDVAQPVVARVIGSFMGLTPEDDAVWARLMNAIVARATRTPRRRARERDGEGGAGGVRALRELIADGARPPPMTSRACSSTPSSTASASRTTRS